MGKKYGDWMTNKLEKTFGGRVSGAVMDLAGVSFGVGLAMDLGRHAAEIWWAEWIDGDWTQPYP